MSSYQAFLYSAGLKRDRTDDHDDDQRADDRPEPTVPRLDGVDGRGLGSVALVARAEWTRTFEAQLGPGELAFFRRCVAKMPPPQLERMFAVSVEVAALALRAEMPRHALTTRELDVDTIRGDES